MLFVSPVQVPISKIEEVLYIFTAICYDTALFDFVLGFHGKC